MDELSILEWIQRLADENAILAYFILAIFSIIENLFPPIPGDTIVVFAAVLVGAGMLSFYPTLISTTIGSVIGFMIIYYIGYRISTPRQSVDVKDKSLLNRLSQYFSSHLQQMDRVDRLFNRFGYWIILLNRFLSGIRSVISFFAGVSKLNVWIVITLVFLSSLVWNLMLILLGIQAGENWEQIVIWIKRYGYFVIAIFISCVLGYQVYLFQKKRKNRSLS